MIIKNIEEVSAINHEYSVIGDNIKKIRKEKKISQKKLGEMLGVSQSAIAQFENSKSIPRLETIAKIADVLGVSIEDLMPSLFNSYYLSYINSHSDSEAKELFENSMLALLETKMNVHISNLKHINSILESIDHKYVNELSGILHKDEEIQEMFWKIVESLDLLNKNGFEKVSDFADDMQKIDEYRIGYTPIIHTDDE